MTYRQPAGLFVPAADAAMVAAGLRALERELRKGELRLPRRAVELRADAEAIASGAKAEPAARSEPDQWLSAEVAAELLGLSVRYTRDLPGIRRRKVGRVVLLAQVDVEEEVAARRAAAAGSRKMRRVA